MTSAMKVRGDDYLHSFSEPPCVSLLHLENVADELRANLAN